MLSLIFEADAFFRTVPANVKLAASLPVVVMGLWFAYQWHLDMLFPADGIYSVRSYRKGGK